MTVKLETRGRKALPPEKRKAPQATIKINDAILPFVKELKSNLKNGHVTNKTLERLFNTLNHNGEQASALPELVREEKSNNNQLHDLENEVQRLKDALQKAQQSNIVKPLEPNERLELIEKYHSEHLKVVRLESQNLSNKSTIKSLKFKINSLEHLEHGCQANTGNGERCTRLAKTTLDWHGVEIKVCIQHSKSLNPVTLSS